MSKLYIKNRYGQIPNQILNDNTLSFQAKGLWGYIQSKPDGWDFSSERIQHDTKDGRDSIRKGLKELEDAGLLIREKFSKGKGTWEHEYHLLEATLSTTEFTALNNTATYNQAINKERPKKERISNSQKQNSSSLASNAVNEVRNHMDIVNEYETSGKFNIDELMSKAVANEYERPGLEKLGVVFLDYYVANKDKLEGKVNIKARFNKFVQTDYHNLLTKKAVWPGIEQVTDEEFAQLMEAGHFKTSTCPFYLEKVKPTLDTQGLNTFNLMIDFFRNKDIGDRKGIRFHDWLIKKGYIIA